MTRLLIICEYATLNGGERSLLAVLPQVQAAGIEPLVMAPATGPLAEALAGLNIKVTPLPFLQAAPGETKLSQSQKRERLQSELQRIAPQLLHANSLSMSRLLGPVAVALSVPSLGHLRDMLRPSGKALADMALNSRLLAVSQATRAWYLELGVPAERVKVLYNGVDLATFQPRPASGALHRELGLPPNVPLVGGIGQLGMRKGFDIFLAAAAQLPRNDVHFVILGERNSTKDEAIAYEAALHQAAAAPPLAGRCHFLGRRDDVPKILNELTLLWHAARQEPLGRVLLEAAAAGTPVVATEVGGTAEIFSPGSGTAMLVPPEDSAALAAAGEQLLADSALRSAQAQRARQRVEQHYSSVASSEALLAHYREMLDGAT